jgi:hypothetical protein
MKFTDNIPAELEQLYGNLTQVFYPSCAELYGWNDMSIHDMMAALNMSNLSNLTNASFAAAPSGNACGNVPIDYCANLPVIGSLNVTIFNDSGSLHPAANETNNCTPLLLYSNVSQMLNHSNMSGLLNTLAAAQAIDADDLTCFVNLTLANHYEVVAEIHEFEANMTNYSCPYNATLEAQNITDYNCTKPKYEGAVSEWALHWHGPPEQRACQAMHYPCTCDEKCHLPFYDDCCLKCWPATKLKFCDWHGTGEGTGMEGIRNRFQKCKSKTIDGTEDAFLRDPCYEDYRDEFGNDLHLIMHNIRNGTCHAGYCLHDLSQQYTLFECPDYPENGEHCWERYYRRGESPEELEQQKVYNENGILIYTPPLL